MVSTELRKWIFICAGLVLSIGFGFVAVSTGHAQVIINETDADNPSTDMLEFVELYDGGAGNTALDGLVVVFFNGNGDVAYTAFDLDGHSTDSEGYFVLGNSAVQNVDLVFSNNKLQNGADAVALYSGDGADFPNGTAVTTNALIDAIVYDTNDADDAGLLVLLNSGQPQVNEGAGGDKDNHSNQRIPNGSGETRNTSTYRQLPPTPGTKNKESISENAVEIFEIQGAGLASPLVEQTVTTESNVVTAVAANGFFIQTPESRADADPETSNGIFVFTDSAPQVAVGDLVDVTGQVVELFDFTQIGGNPSITVKSSAHALPAAIEFDANLPSPNQPQPQNEMERYEGMLVKVTNGTAAGANDRFGEVKIIAGPNRPFREPGIIFPGQPNLPVWDGNPEIFELDPDGLGLDDIQIHAGAEIISATGPLFFSFGDYQLLPAELSVEGVTSLRPVRDREEHEAIIATQNLLRLFDHLDDPNLNEPVPTEEEFKARLSKLSRYIREVLKAPNILAVQEVENLGVLQALADEIQTDDPAIIYTAFLKEGNDIGGIDVGFLARSTVIVDSVKQIGKGATFEFNGTIFTLHDRPPLILYGRLDSEAMFPITVMTVHNRSLGGIDSGDSTRVRTKRFQQALWISQRIQEMQHANPDILLVVLGDFNAFEFTDGFVDVLGQITGNLDPSGTLFAGTDEVQPDLTNRILSLPPEERYSFIFRGSAQALDHVLTSQALETFVKGVAFSRGNADAPYRFESDASTPLRSSDHDGLALYVDIGIIDAIDEQVPAASPADFFLAQNYPNPFNPETVIHFSLPHAGHMSLHVFNTLGQKVRTLADQEVKAGYHQAHWEGRDDRGNPVPSGIYYYQLQAGNKKQVKKMILLR
ncbi:MAG: T9SS type A sorting domain-containing protein [bacterium]